MIERLYHEDGWFLAARPRLPGSGAPAVAASSWTKGGVRRLEVVGVEAPMGNRIADYLVPVLDGTPLTPRCL